MTEILIADTLMQDISKVFEKEVGALSRDTRLREDLNAKSMQKLAIAASVEELTGKRVSYAQINNCKTLGEVIEFAETLLKPR